jgi:hypothetical protein
MAGAGRERRAAWLPSLSRAQASVNVGGSPWEVTPTPIGPNNYW